MTDIARAILSINPDAKFSMQDLSDYNSIVWEDGTKSIPKKEIEKKISELKLKYDSEEYKRLRQKKYPLIVDQLDEIYHNGIDAWKETIKAVKDKYPKE